jgi:hypothetical protein
MSSRRITGLNSMKKIFEWIKTYGLIFLAGLGIGLLMVVLYAKKFIPHIVGASDSDDGRSGSADGVRDGISGVGDGLSGIGTGADVIDAGIDSVERGNADLASGADHIANGIAGLRAIIQRLREESGRQNSASGAGQFIP